MAEIGLQHWSCCCAARRKARPSLGSLQGCCQASDRRYVQLDS